MIFSSTSGLFSFYKWIWNVIKLIRFIVQSGMKLYPRLETITSCYSPVVLVCKRSSQLESGKHELFLEGPIQKPKSEEPRSLKEVGGQQDRRSRTLKIKRSNPPFSFFCKTLTTNPSCNLHSSSVAESFRIKPQQASSARVRFQVNIEIRMINYDDLLTDIFSEKVDLLGNSCFEFTNRGVEIDVLDARQMVFLQHHGNC